MSSSASAKQPLMRSNTVSTRRREEQEERRRKKRGLRPTKSFPEKREQQQQQQPYVPKRALTQQEVDFIFEQSLNALRVTKEDMVSIVNNEDDSFRKLQQSLRKRGCVTNGFIKESMHLYVQHMKHVKAARSLSPRPRQHQQESRHEETNLRKGALAA